MNRPAAVVHCDWGTDPKKRWMATALLHDSQYTAYPPEPVGNLNDPAHPQQPFIARIRALRKEREAVLLGFDFPIGIPQRFAEQAHIPAFKPFLNTLAQAEWKHFYDVADKLAEVSIHRPFYPNQTHPKGETRQQPFLDRLNATNINDLRRLCELKQPNRAAASPLFWTLGGNQVGKAAIRGWQQVICPILNDPDIKLWPFDGTLENLLQPGNLVIAETYPTQYHPWLFGKAFLGKRSHSARQRMSPPLLKWADTQSVCLHDDLREQIRSGFPPSTFSKQPAASERKDNEDDRFDAILGLFGMLHLMAHPHLLHEPTNPTLRTIEGWILGQPSHLALSAKAPPPTP